MMIYKKKKKISGYFIFEWEEENIFIYFESFYFIFTLIFWSQIFWKRKQSIREKKLTDEITFTISPFK